MRLAWVAFLAQPAPCGGDARGARPDLLAAHRGRGCHRVLGAVARRSAPGRFRRGQLANRGGAPHPVPLYAHPYPNLCSHFWSVTRVSTQGLLFFGRGSGRIASPAQRERPTTEGRRVRASAHVAQAPCSKPCLPSPADADVGDLSRCRGRGDAAPGPSRVLSSLRVGVHFLHSYGCSRCGVGGLSRNLGNDEPLDAGARGPSPRPAAGIFASPRRRGERPTRGARRVRGSSPRPAARGEADARSAAGEGPRNFLAPLAETKSWTWHWRADVICGGLATEAERLLWRLLRGRQFAGVKFRRQHPVGPYILDFYSAERRLAVELDGGQHFTAEGQAYDGSRSDFWRRAECGSSGSRTGRSSRRPRGCWR